MDINKFIYDFIGRTESMFSTDLLKYKEDLSKEVKGKNVLVIGAAGSIGSSFISAILDFKPKKIVAVDINENGLTELVRDIRSTDGKYIPSEFYTYPVSFDSSSFRKLFHAHGPFEIITNFAAHKHVRSEKDIYSIQALLENNVIKAKGLLDLLLDIPPKHFFCVSTDKAANPVNIMGASKKLMEELILSYSPFFKTTSARFANVAFSNGSLLDGFIKRVDKLQPLACPSDVKRFFVSHEESGQICLLACILGKTGEIFFPKLDMVNDLTKFSDILPSFLLKKGFEAVYFKNESDAKSNLSLINKGKYPVFLFETNTSGEKLFEEFYTEDEVINIDHFNSLGVVIKQPSYDKKLMDLIIYEIENLFESTICDKSMIVNWLKKYIPNFNHIETGVGLDSKM